MNNTVLPPALSEAQRNGIHGLVDRLSSVPGVEAVVLGGSFARGTQRAGSDVDLGLYYRPEAPFAIEEIRRVAEAIASSPPTVTDFYGWGAWVNGGAWIKTPWGKVDFLYRNLEQVERTIDDAERGIVHHDYPQQPAYGFYSVIYLAETSICIPLYDPTGAVTRLKARVATYPAQLKAQVANGSLWSGEFTLLHARSFAESGDVYNTAGCLTRTAANLTQALFALNERYFMSDKRAMETIDGFAVKPAGYVAAITAVLAAPGHDAPALAASVRSMEAVWRSVVELTGGGYRPQFTL
jgi:hypothetical protein